MAAKESQDSPQFTVSKNGMGSRGTRTFRVPASELNAFIASLHSSTLSIFGMVTPLDTITVTPLGCVHSNPTMNPLTSYNTYDEWEVTANYGFPSGGGSERDQEKPKVRERKSDGSFIELESTTGTTPMFIEGTGLKWQYHTLKDVPFVSKDGQYISFQTTDYSIVWGDVAQPNWAKLEALCGTLNDDTFPIPLTNSAPPAETLLFDGFSAGTRFSLYDESNPQYLWRLSIKLRKRNLIGRPMYTAENTKVTSDGVTNVIGWNHLYRSIAGKEGFERAYFYDVGGTKEAPTYSNRAPIYPLADWSEVFNQASP